MPGVQSDGSSVHHPCRHLSMECDCRTFSHGSYGGEFMKLIPLLLAVALLAGCEKRTSDEPQRAPIGSLLPGSDVHRGDK